MLLKLVGFLNNYIKDLTCLHSGIAVKKEIHKARFVDLWSKIVKENSESMRIIIKIA